MPASALAAYLDFDEADLAANRAGQLSPRQLQNHTLAAKVLQRALLFKGLVQWGVAGAGPLLLYIWSRVYGPVLSNADAWLLAALCGTGLLGWIYWWSQRGLRLIRQALAPPPILVTKVTDLIKYHKTKRYQLGRAYTFYELHLRGRKLTVDAALAQYLLPDHTYTLYVLEKPLSILSVEPQPSAPPHA